MAFSTQLQLVLNLILALSQKKMSKGICDNLLFENNTLPLCSWMLHVEVSQAVE
jgi:hypothetical protein